MAAVNTFEKYNMGLISPMENCFAITPDDNSDLPFVTRYLYIGHNEVGGGDHTFCTIRMTFLGGQTVTLTHLNHGVLYPFRITKVFVTGTDSDNIFGMY